MYVLVLYPSNLRFFLCSGAFISALEEPRITACYPKKANETGLTDNNDLVKARALMEDIYMNINSRMFQK